MNAARITALHCYPIKSARGWPLTDALLTATGFEHDREWMLIDELGKFLTQRELPQLATLQAELRGDQLGLRTPNQQAIYLPARHDSPPRCVRIWRDECSAFDCGDEVAAWLSQWLARSVRMVRFDSGAARYSDAAWTGDTKAANMFSDGFPILVANLASLADLNARMGRELSMERFRPNIVLGDLPAYAEDRIDELRCGKVRLKLVKPCTRCVITTTDQQTGQRDGDEPLRTLRSFRHDKSVQGVTFAQNAIVLTGVGAQLHVGDSFTIQYY